MFDISAARAHMIESQIRTSDVTNLALLGAFRSIAREKFVPKAQNALAYADAHITLEKGRVMLRPRDFAKMVQAVNVESTDIVLDIGSGRGYSAAILAQLAETVVGLEVDDDCVDRATKLLTEADITNAVIVKGDLKSGASEHGPFDVIFVNGAVSSVAPSWLKQLSNNGRLICLIQKGAIGQVTLFHKSGDIIGQRVIFDASAPYLDGFLPQDDFVF